MSRLSTFLAGFVCGAAALWGALNFHVIRAKDGLHVAAKRPPRWSETYVDVRHFTLSEWANHPQLAAALVQAKKQHLLGESAADAVKDTVSELVPNWPQQ